MMPRTGESNRGVDQELAVRRRAFEVVQSLPENYEAALAVLAFAKSLVEETLDPEKLSKDPPLKLVASDGLPHDEPVLAE